MVRRRVLAALAAALVVTTGASCSKGDTAAPAADDPPIAGEQAAPGAARAAPSTTEPPVPDQLPDPKVAPGACSLVTYTPPTTAEPQQGELCRPASAARDTAVILVHGGSGVSGGMGSLRPWAARLGVEGYVTLNIDYHLFQPGYVDQSPVFPLPELNVKAAVQYLRGVGNAVGVRKDRVVVQGHSAGARIGATAYVSAADRWFGQYDDAGTSGVHELWPDLTTGVDGFIGFYHPYDGTMQYADQYYGGSESSTDRRVAERWAKADSIANAAGATGPALFVTGDQDDGMIFAQEAAFADRLRAAGLHARQVTISGGGHGFDEGDPTRLSKLGEQALTEVLTFLNTEFPQEPGRTPQSGPVDLAAAPAATGVAPPTYVSRTVRTYAPYVPSGGGVGNGGGSGNGAVTTTSALPGNSTTTVAVPSTPSSVAVTTQPSVTAPTTIPEPPTTIPSPVTTLAPPPSTVESP